MQKLIKLFLILALLINITACNVKENKILDVDTSHENFVKAELNENEEIVIVKNDITSDATFINYQVGGVIIQLIAVRDTDGIIRLAFNTCQSCNPSPNAYFIQDKEYFICQNCHNAFHVDSLGESNGGCNPLSVLEFEDTEDIITIKKAYVEEFIGNFVNWNGPTM